MSFPLHVVDAFSQERINLTLKELQEEQDGVKHLL